MNSATSLTPLALLLIGFSVFSALSLALTHFRAAHYPGQGMSRAMGLVLLGLLVVLQLAHFAGLYADLPLVNTVAYRALLFAVAPVFFLFSQPLLLPQYPIPWRPVQLLHGVPLLLSPWMPQAVALPTAFLLGAGYLAWLAWRMLGLRAERARFALEMGLLGATFVIALAVALLGVVQARLPGSLFYQLYAIAIGGAFFLVQTALGLRPQLASEVSETAQAAYASYATSTLTQVDCTAVLARFHQLIHDEHMYTDADLSLSILAGRLGLNSHQLSELMNTRLGKGFSRYLREARVQAAQAMLCAEPSASVLSVGLNVGFTSQSNFYEAFREIAGTTPGQYRKLHHP
ncbi:MAG: AraC family transcriptional regulator [Burkholderiales bacterium PBB4]|nr:MAG: AraC family transcriptional regulator [Burkholderiales bacterium PBB4]